MSDPNPGASLAAGIASVGTKKQPLVLQTRDTSSADKRRSAWLVRLIIVANVVVFGATMCVNNCRAHSHSNPYGKCVNGFLGRFSFQPIKENPLLGPSNKTLERLGALEWDKVVNQHQGWRLVTYIWLHAGLLHLFPNLYTLAFVGVRLEHVFGFVRIGAIYLISGFAASIFSLLCHRRGFSIGPSGAVFGLLGAMLSELIANWTIYNKKAQALFILTLHIAIYWAIGMLFHLDKYAHIGGFITGVLLGFILFLKPQFGWLERQNLPLRDPAMPKFLAYQCILAAIALALLIAGSILGLVMLFREEGRQ